MIYRYSTIEKGGQRYLRSVALLAEQGQPDYRHTFPAPIAGGVTTKDGRLRWRVVPNPRHDPNRSSGADNPAYQFLEEPEPMRPGRLAREAEQAEAKRIADLYSRVQERKLLVAGLRALAAGQPLPEEVRVYCDQVEGRSP